MDALRESLERVSATKKSVAKIGAAKASRPAMKAVAKKRARG